MSYGDLLWRSLSSSLVCYILTGPCHLIPGHIFGCRKESSWTVTSVGLTHTDLPATRAWDLISSCMKPQRTFLLCQWNTKEEEVTFSTPKRIGSWYFGGLEKNLWEDSGDKTRTCLSLGFRNTWLTLWLTFPHELLNFSFLSRDDGEAWREPR